MTTEAVDAGALGVHQRCVVCGGRSESGLRLSFRRGDDGAVEASFDCDGAYMGYDGMIHGGVVAALLDAAMTQALFAWGLTCVTAEMKIRYRQPLIAGTPARVVGRLADSYPPLYYMSAEVLQDGRTAAEATAKFMHQPHLAAGGEA